MNLIVLADDAFDALAVELDRLARVIPELVELFHRSQDATTPET